jgi:LCP family protein required for cell wall assembly
MRTTLKKRSRRSANGNGNGNGAYPPDFPVLTPAEPEPALRVAPAPPPPPRPPAPVPTAGSERAFYRVRRNPLKLLVKGVMWLVVAVLVAAGALAGGVKLYFDYSVAAVRPTSKEVIRAAEQLDAVVAGKPAVAIVSGYDKRPGEVSAGRSDTVMLLRADPEKKALTMLSFPRDLIVQHAGCEGHPSWTGKINESYAYCGPRGTLMTVKDLTGIPINYMITVNFRAFTNIVDKVGGVYMDVDHRYFNDNAGAGAGGTYAKIDLQPGYQQLNGKQALDFVRFRHTDSDLYRVVRQQEFVKALKQRISTAWDIFQLPGIVKAVTENIEVGKGGGKELSAGEVLKYANLAYTLPAGNFQQVPLDGVSGYSELTVAESSIDAAVRRFMNPDVKASEKAIAVATGSKPKGEEAPPPSEVGIEIVNGNGVAGAADEATVLLGQIGYDAENAGNADNFDYFRTEVQYEPEIPKAKAAAQAVADLFGEADVEAAPASEPLTTMVRVVLGKTFAGTLGPAPADDTPERQVPQIVRDPGSITPALRALRKRLDFPVLVPTVREEGSSIDDDEGIRPYKVSDHRSLRLTYHTASNEYWGIQETSWEDPPILDEPTLERTIRGRRYKLFFSGPKLHIVAFEADGGTYWVVNTLRNTLSNETMLAIARGLKPLGSS